MKTVPTDLIDHLAGGVTTLCHCWKAERHDGVTVGFTDHDRPLAFGGTTYDPAAGLAASELTAGPGLAVAGGEVDGALALDGLDAGDLSAGLWDDARVEIWLVNWEAVGQRLHVATGHIGEVETADGAFRAELRSLASRLDQPRGRIFASHCDAVLGDERCGVNLATATYRATGTVIDTDGRRTLTASGLAGFDDAWFSRGTLTWTSGANKSFSVEVKRHTVGAGHLLTLWQAAGRTIEEGDTFTIRAGCDKRFATCREKFANAEAFRGFPHMPGNDFALSYPSPEGENEGRRRDKA
ncbi:DUF2163 domain-containing protein [Rhodobium gokarnense]|uniref:Phage protein (TIGR02218 family) n=1 Tax=Rhodobium gokarnense TaxID=364296 RepID=A0ABT3HBW2_9HYPH|nr:DUF2163 domain-containing protein [Rhodobium gokarnense]MCW2307887.1 putative phage protein (TIGR02218 family) [Rhodobium gokarnense]